ncbi:MAG: phage shock protein PspA [Gammaproteobacteria bacterium]|nr:phage shock protein PspA [Gammaproteobacteria bacterium]
MGIFSRFADIVNANLNALLDKAEDPEKMVRLIIQEMEDTLVEVRTASARTIADKKELERKLAYLEQEIADWEAKASLALSKDREDLARGALVEKAKIAEVAATVRHELELLNGTLSKLSDEIGQLQDKLKDAKARQAALMMRHKTAESRLKVRSTIQGGGSGDAVSKFERYERKLDNLEAEVDAFDLGKKSSLADEIANLEAEDKVSQELEALKAKINQQNNN